MLSLHLTHVILTVIVTAAVNYSYYFMSFSTIIPETCQFFVLSTLSDVVVLPNAFSLIVLMVSSICVNAAMKLKYACSLEEKL